MPSQHERVVWNCPICGRLEDGTGPCAHTGPPEQAASGQIWRHHSTGLYRVFRIDDVGRPWICNNDREERYAVPVWPDYFYANFKLAVAAHA